ncbi:MAG: hypothetical protein AB1806_19925 [Acidobacteriota bacterium]
MACIAAVAVCVAQLAAEQGRDASQVLADAQAAMGGGKLTSLKSLTANGRVLRTGPDGATRENEFELSLQLPDKYLLRSVMAAMGSMSIYRNTGFNGDRAIDEIDRPPNLSTGGGLVMFRMAGPGGTSVDPEKMTPEQRAEFEKTRLLANRRECTRLALGMFAAAPPFFPLEITYAGEAESADGKADALDLKGEGFEARLFIDAQTHLPLMLSWMDREPLVMQVGGPAGTGRGTVTVAGGGQTRVVQGGGNPNATQEERDKVRAELEARLKEAEANRRTVEFRIFYSDYQEVGGVMLPHRIQRSVEGKPTEEMIFESFKVNPKIDARTFEPINK